jgi:hypothetical protein
MRVAGVDFAMSTPRNAPFTPFHAGLGRHGARVRPLYYAMLLFAEATSHRARLLSSTTGSGRPSRGRLRAWAAYDRVDRVVRVVLDHKADAHGGYVVIHVPRAAGTAKLKRLSAPRVVSTDNVSWGGQKFAKPSFDGRLVGTPRIQISHRRSGSRFRVRMPKAGVALLTVPVRRR